MVAQPMNAPVPAPMPPTTGDKSPKPPGSAEPPHYHGHRERLRGRFREASADALSNYELLEMVLFRALPRRDVKPLAKELIGKFGSFAEVVHAPEPRLLEVSGLGEAAMIELKLVAAASSRVAKGLLKQRAILSSSASVIEYCRSSMVVVAFADKEQFRILFLDKRNQLIADELQQVGTIDHMPVYPREVVKRALELSATAIIMAHNHPSGDPSPSQADIQMTKANHRDRKAARDRHARSHHRRQRRPRESERDAAHLGRCGSSRVLLIGSIAPTDRSKQTESADQGAGGPNACSD